MELPKGIPNDTKVLNLAENVLKEIPKNGFMDLPHLILLNLTGNSIDKPFEIPESVMMLHARGNQLQDIDLVMKNGVQLKTVDFEGNRMTAIGRDTFARCTQLTHV
ncbi:leucine-rich repeat-containing protein 47-like [Patiria miniata]|uniref:Uncharacterized protein n=1 Tax=Patiria miniata TaxID=46514 RepID=A0A914A456_PATMI|nr:leucine-rich repeat-containing protein 47-like [Patiria miniata]